MALPPLTASGGGGIVGGGGGGRGGGGGGGGRDYSLTVAAANPPSSSNDNWDSHKHLGSGMSAEGGGEGGGAVAEEEHWTAAVLAASADGNNNSNGVGVNGVKERSDSGYGDGRRPSSSSSSASRPLTRGRRLSARMDNENGASSLAVGEGVISRHHQRSISLENRSVEAYYKHLDRFRVERSDSWLELQRAMATPAAAPAANRYSASSEEMTLRNYLVAIVHFLFW